MPLLKLPELVIYAQGSGTNGRAHPPPGEAQVFCDSLGRVCGEGCQHDGVVWLDYPEHGAFRLDVDAGRVEAYPYPGVPASAVQDLYQRSALPLFLQAVHYEVLHGSAILTPAGVVAFCAGPGAGKSTLAAGLARRGYRPWADDSLIFEYSPGGARSWPAPFQLRLPEEAARLLYQLFPPGGRVQTAGRRPRGPVPLAGVCLLERDTRPSGPAKIVVEQLTPPAALLGLLLHACAFSLAGRARRRERLANYLGLATSLPVLRLSFDTHLEELEDLLDWIEANIIHTQWPA